MLAKCKTCGQVNRLRAPWWMSRCGKCKTVFSEVDLMEASIGETLSGGGIKSVQFVDEDGTVRGGFDIPTGGR